MPDRTLLIVAAGDVARGAISAEIERHGVKTLSCTSFGAAVEYMLTGAVAGIIADLATAIKAKDEEKRLCQKLFRLLPSLKIKCIGELLVPMTMSGDAPQEKTVEAFIAACAAALPRKLRRYRRRRVCLPAMVDGRRCFVSSISRGGFFVVDMKPECFSTGDEVVCELAGSFLQLCGTVARTVRWGEANQPGIGVEFRGCDTPVLELLRQLGCQLSTGQ